MLETTPNFALLTPCKNQRRGGRDLYTNCLSFAYDRTYGIHLMAINWVDAERGVLIKKRKERKKVHGLNLRPYRLTSGGLISADLH